MKSISTCIMFQCMCGFPLLTSISEAMLKCGFKLMKPNVLLGVGLNYELYQKFGRDLHHNYMRELITIKQTSDVLEYAARFEQAKHKVLVHNRDTWEVFFVQNFIDGLRHSISNAIILHKPRTVYSTLPLSLIAGGVIGNLYKEVSIKIWKGFHTRLSTSASPSGTATQSQ